MVKTKRITLTLSTDTELNTLEFYGVAEGQQIMVRANCSLTNITDIDKVVSHSVAYLFDNDDTTDLVEMQSIATELGLTMFKVQAPESETNETKR